MDHRPSADLLESHHTFPGVYQIKAIGAVDGLFENRVLEAVVAENVARSEIEFTSRMTPGGRHMALTLHVPVENAEQVRSIYARIRDVEGLWLLL
jgi:uncharacterized protein